MDNEKIKVLLIEDNPGDARLIRELLAEVEGAPFDVYHTDRLSAGLERLAQGDIDVILLDLSLPDSKGLDSLGKLHAQAPKVPIVVLSGLSDEAVAVKAVQEGAQDYLVKGSIDGGLLVRSLRYAIERHRLRVELHESEARYRLLADNVADIVWTADAEARITYVSPSIKRLLGYTVDEAMGLKIGDILTADSLEQARRFVKGQMNMRAWGMHYPPASMTLEHVRKDGSTVWAEVMLSFMQSQDGSIIGIMGATRDITGRREAEEALRHSEERYRELFENAHDIIYTHDLAGNFASINKMGEQVTGYTREEALSMNISRLLTAESLELARQMMDRKVNQGGPTRYELEIIAKDGHRVLLEVSTRLIYEGENPVGVQGIARDITERKRMEQELLCLSDAVKLSKDGMTITDLEGRIIELNEATLKMHGMDNREDLIGRLALELISAEDREMATEKMTTALAEGGLPLILEYHCIKNDGSTSLCEATISEVKDKNGEHTGYMAVVRDITERERVEEQLRRLSDAFRMSQDSIIITDPQGIVVDFNEATLKLFGVSDRTDFIGKNPADLLVLEDLGKGLASMKKAIEEGNVSALEYYIKRGDGSKLPVEVSASIFRNAKDESVGFVVVARDVTERKRMENALRESEEKHRLYFENVFDVVFSISPEGTILSISPSVERILGYKPEELTGKKMTDLGFIAPEALEQGLVDIARIFTGERMISLAVEFIHRGGTKILGEVSGAPIYSSDGKVVAAICVARDITERKRLEDELRENEERFRTVFEGSSMGIALVDFGGKILGVNPAFQQMIGYSLEEFRRLTNLEYLHPDDAMMDAKLYMDMVKGKRDHYTVDKRYIRKDRQVLWGRQNLSVVRDAEGKARYFVAIVEDITERKRMEETLRQREQGYLLLLESTFEGMIVVDAETMKVVFGNRRASKMFGFDPILGDGIGLNILDLIHPEDREAVVRGVVEDLQTLERRKKYEVRAKTRDGREIWVDALATRIEFQGRLAILLSMKDVTERKRVEEEKRRLEEQIQLAGRLAAVGELAAGVAHELNNPIAAIRGFAQLLNGRKDVDEATKKDLSTIYSEAQRVSKITQNLLTFARKHEPEKRLISMNEAVEKTLELRAHQMTMNNIELVLELDAELPLTMADSHQMQQVFLNIINNAEQAMVEAHGKGRLEVKTEKAGGLIRITFSDDGPGIPEENLERIFDPFFTTKEVGKGTGLGLSICYGLVAAHGGHIHVRSNLGGGATFVVEIPPVSEDSSSGKARVPNPRSRGMR